jgi:hypothetical protein
VIVLSPTAEAADPFGIGRPASVELVDSQGKTLIQTLTRNSQAELCDFGFGPHTIIVARDSCTPVVLQNIRLRIGETQKFYVVLNPCAHYFGTKGCSVYFRISSNVGGPLSNPHVSVSGLTEPLVADRYGRLSTALLSGSAATYDISAPEHERAILTVTCKEREEFEKAVVLKKVP